MSHEKCLGRIVARVESARAERGLPDIDPLVTSLWRTHVERLLQAARNLDAESIRQAEEDPVLRDLLG